MIVVTGGAGFIGSNIVADLDAAGYGPIAVCDWLGSEGKWRNLAKHPVAAFVLPDTLHDFLNLRRADVRAVIHMGAVSSTTETDADLLIRLNINATCDLWDWCARNETPFIYASSAAVYGGLESGLMDDESPSAIAALRPLNAYGWSKKVVDQALLARVAAGMLAPPQWVGLRFFNVYGPNEYHKGDMRSVVTKIFDPVRRGDAVRLFKSGRGDIADGEQRRDFIYVKDCAAAVRWFLDHAETSGIFNLGTGQARTFNDLARALGLALEREVTIEFVDMPDALRGSYQYTTQAAMQKLNGRGMVIPFHSLEAGILDYVQGYLAQPDQYR